MYMLSTSLLIVKLLLINFHSLSFQSDGNTISMSNFQNKKVLIVNIATGSDKAGQLSDLQQLQLQFADSLVIIAFPSNSFGNEPRSDADIRQFCQQNYSTSFLIATKSSVSGSALNPVIGWLADKTKNGELDAAITNDFQKFLITKEGMIVGVFSSKVSPLDADLIEAINMSY